jgi:phage replication initiation protein
MKTCIDWLSFRTKSNQFKILENLRRIFGTAGADDLLTLRTGQKGRDGWETSSDLMISDIRIGGIDSGGDSQRDWLRVQLTGEGCSWVQHWDLVEVMAAYLEEPELRRLDIALTTFHGELGIDSVIKAHALGQFKGTTGGVSPGMRTIRNANKFEGDTVYIGDRKSDKFLRCYEKGKEAMKALPPNQRALITTYEGYPIDDVFRVELELKAKEIYIPWTAIRRRDDVFAGAYPFCASILPDVPEWKMQKMPDFKPRSDMTAALENCRNSYGSILRTALEFFGGDRDKLLNAILANQPSDRLIESGVLTI